MVTSQQLSNTETTLSSGGYRLIKQAGLRPATTVIKVRQTLVQVRKQLKSNTASYNDCCSSAVQQ